MDGFKHYIDHDIDSIQNFISEETLNKYNLIDMNIYQSNIFHTRMMVKDIDYQIIFEIKEEDLSAEERT